jgi:hypothetical protein
MFFRQSFLFPSLSHGGQELFLVCSHLPNERLVAGLFMSGRPQHHFRQDRREINPSGSQRINSFAAIGRISPRLDNSIGFQAAETVSQNICCDFLVGVEKFVKGLVSTEHHVAQDQERPTISQHLHRGIQRKSGTALMRRFLFLHGLSVANITCTLQVRLADCLSGGGIRA